MDTKIQKFDWRTWRLETTLKTWAQKIILKWILMK